MKADTTSMVTQISYDELLHAWAPLADVSIVLDKCLEKAGTGLYGKMIGAMDDKLKRALEPIKECLDRIEEENPDQFS